MPAYLWNQGRGVSTRSGLGAGTEQRRLCLTSTGSARDQARPRLWKQSPSAPAVSSHRSLALAKTSVGFSETTRPQQPAAHSTKPHGRRLHRSPTHRPQQPIANARPCRWTQNQIL